MSFHTSRCNLLHYLLLFLLCLGPASSIIQAQDSARAPISTERPCVGPSPDIIAAGSLQVESGVGASLQHHQYVADLPENMVRVGLTNRIELRFVSSNLVVTHSMTEGFNSFQTQDLTFSVKAIIGASNKFIPRSAIASLSSPTGGPAQTSGSYDPTLAVIWPQALPSGFSIIEVAQTTLTTFRGNRAALWGPSFGFGKTLSTKYSVFGEYAPVVLPDHSLTHTVDGGLLYAPNSVMQFDSRFGYIHDAVGFHTLISFGCSRRFDHFLALGRSAPLTH